MATNNGGEGAGADEVRIDVDSYTSTASPSNKNKLTSSGTGAGAGAGAGAKTGSFSKRSPVRPLAGGMVGGSSSSNPKMTYKRQMLEKTHAAGGSFAERERKDYESKEGDPRKLVKLGFNLLQIDKIDDQANTFSVNFLLHLEFPVSDEGKPPYEIWRPWCQFKNAVELGELHNRGARRLDLADIRRLLAEGKVNFGDRIRDTVNYVGRFAKTLDHTNFPFDSQELTVIMTSNSTKDTVMTYLSAGAIKANFEMDVLSEWYVLRDEKGHAVTYYAIEGSNMSLSANEKSYWTLFFTIVVIRDYGAVIKGNVLPTMLLALSSLFSFALSAEEENGDRLGLIFTAILTIVANQFSTKERLPNISNMTLVDKFMLSMQLCCYVVALVSVLTPILATGFDDYSVTDVDRFGFGICCAMFVLVILTFYLRTLALIRDRQQFERNRRDLAHECRINDHEHIKGATRGSV